ncbi:hypothetical protein MTP03_26380 [Tsukamurella sp. PLM1]|nr:hypothetical protein MTP03_26380 [Tsukamurella sp. PLM1]
MPSPLPPPPTLLSTPRRRVVAGAALLVAATVLGLALNVWHGFLDLEVYRLGARTWLDGGDLYGKLPPIGDIALPFTYPPLAAIAFVPFAVMSSWAAGAVMFALTLGAIGLTLWLVLAHVRPGSTGAPGSRSCWPASPPPSTSSRCGRTSASARSTHCSWRRSR